MKVISLHEYEQKKKIGPPPKPANSPIGPKKAQNDPMEQK